MDQQPPCILVTVRSTEQSNIPLHGQMQCPTRLECEQLQIDPRPLLSPPITFKWMINVCQSRLSRVSCAGSCTRFLCFPMQLLELQPPLWKRRCAHWRRPLVMSILPGGTKSQAVAPLPRDVGNGVDTVAKISLRNCIAVGPLHGAAFRILLCFELICSFCGTAFHDVELFCRSNAPTSWDGVCHVLLLLCGQLFCSQPSWASLAVGGAQSFCDFPLVFPWCLGVAIVRPAKPCLRWWECELKPSSCQAAT